MEEKYIEPVSQKVFNNAQEMSDHIEKRFEHIKNIFEILKGRNTNEIRFMLRSVQSRVDTNTILK